MIQAEDFIKELQRNGIDFFAGVPDSLLKNVCAYITDNVDDDHNIITANEGAAIALGAGHYLATGRIPLVYMQNSGQGNTVNPLLSLTDKEVYSIPVLLLIGWRGKPGVHDEPQHVKQGKVTTQLLDAMGIQWCVLSKETEEMRKQVRAAVAHMQESNEAYALIVEKDTFDGYILKKDVAPNLPLGREDAVCAVAGLLPKNDCIVSTTGMISRELFEYRARDAQGHQRDFLTVGSMGHASQIALGIALEKKDRRVWCFDGDGSVLMHMGALALIGSRNPQNLIHVVFNNGAHDSVGGQPTVGLQVDLCRIASACRYWKTYLVSDRTELESVLAELGNIDQQGVVFMEIRVKKGNRKDLGRPTTTPIENKNALMEFLDRR